MSLDVAQKRVELLKELMPHLRTLAILSNTTHPGEQLEYDATQRAAKALSLRLVYGPFTSGAGIDAALEQGLSRSAYLLVKGSGPAPSQTRNLNDLAGSRSPVPGPEMRFT
jgi:ABC-type uncharacterized transport system substrate-binding protein